MRRLVLVVVAALSTVATSASAADEPPIVILVSIDAWRWDYLARANAPNLRALAARGVRAEGLIPPFPPKTFPSHYTMVTGLLPEHHGIVSNTVSDPHFADRFTMSAPTSKNQRWWGGEPVWITAMRQGQRTASMFWPGSEVIGRQPTYWRPFDDAVPNDQRVNQVLEWLALSADQRPSFVTLYFSEVDHAGHDHGPESQQVMDAAAQVDAAIGQLVAGITRSGLLERTTIVVVSDHGMSALSETRVVFLDDYVDLAKIDVIEWTPNLGVRPGGLPVDEVYLALRGKHPALAVYRREEVPAWLRYRDSDRIPPIIGLADDGWMITSRARFAATRAPQGGHGYDPRFVSMHGLFIAAGPRLRRGVIVPGFENLHVYNFLCELLGVRPAPNDGDATVTRGFFAVPNGVISTPRSWR